MPRTLDLLALSWLKRTITRVGRPWSNQHERVLSGASELPARGGFIHGLADISASWGWIRCCFRFLPLSLGPRSTGFSETCLAYTEVIQVLPPPRPPTARPHTHPLFYPEREEKNQAICWGLEVKSRVARDSHPLTSSSSLGLPSTRVVGTCDICVPRCIGSGKVLGKSALQTHPTGWQADTRASAHTATGAHESLTHTSPFFSWA